MMLGLGAGALIVPSVAQHLIASFGWRLTFGIVGAAIVVITVPILTMFLKERPELLGLLPDGRSYSAEVLPRRDVDPGLSWREARHTRSFGFLLCAFILVAAGMQACFMHIAAIVADRGTPAQAAAFATSLFGAGLLIGRTGSGYLLDRFFAPRVAAVMFACAAAGMGLLRLADSQELAFAAALLIGLGYGAEVDIMAYLTSRYFGLRSFGAVYGFLFAGFLVAGGVGGYLMGAVFDAKSSYSSALTFFCITTLIGAALMTHLGPYRYEKPRGDQRGPELELLQSES